MLTVIPAESLSVIETCAFFFNDWLHQIDGQIDDMIQITERLLRSRAASKVEELLHNARHACCLSLNGFCAFIDVVSTKIPRQSDRHAQ